MIIKRFSFKTLEECINKACDELNVSKEQLKYKVIEEKNGIFIKKAVIDVEIDDEKEELPATKGNDTDGMVKVEQGKIVVKNPVEGGKKASITPSKNLNIIVDGREIKGLTEITEESVIQVMNKEEMPQRLLNVEMDEKRMEAYITLKYFPQCLYKLKDSNFTNTLKLEDEVSKKVYPPVYTEQEILNVLENKTIVYGVIKENLVKALDKEGIEGLLIAKGEPPILDEDDVLDIKFKTSNNLAEITDDVQKVDFKNLNSISEVIKGEVLAIKHEGKEGKDGVNIFGREVKRPKKKNVILKAGQGTLVQGDKIIAVIGGKPEYKNGIFYVYPVYEMNNDVDLASGNIDFIGQVIIRGSVKEGMEVKAQGEIIIEKNVTQANILGSNDIVIAKNIISSKVIGGGEDVSVLSEMDCLNKIKDEVEELVKAATQIKTLTNNATKDGEIVKLLIENKFKSIPKTYFKLLNCRCQEDPESTKIINIVRSKLIGLAPIEIQHVNDLNYVITEIDERLDELKRRVSLPVDVTIGYCQDSVIKSSGNIFVNGKGEYVSQLIANDEVCFTNENSVARGGTIFAKNKIQCGIVGSEGGVITKLEVSREGHIFAKRAYQNTLFVVGSREYVLDSYSRDIHVFLDSDGNLSVEKLKG